MRNHPLAVAFSRPHCEARLDGLSYNSAFFCVLQMCVLWLSSSRLRMQLRLRLSQSMTQVRFMEITVYPFVGAHGFTVIA